MRSVRGSIDSSPLGFTSRATRFCVFVVCALGQGSDKSLTPLTVEPAVQALQRAMILAAVQFVTSVIQAHSS